MMAFPVFADGRSAWEHWLELDARERKQLAKGLLRARLVAALTHWTFTRRTAQCTPEGDWTTWLVMAGRGFGKTRTGAEWVAGAARRDARARIALIAPTLHDARAVMLEGESGLLAVIPPTEIRRYEPTRRRLTLEKGGRIEWFSAEEPDSLRGPQFTHAWGDEIGRWPDGPTVWMNLRLALRKSKRPRAVLTTTPRPVPLVRALLADAAAGRGVAITRGRTADNAAFLPASFLAEVTGAYAGTRLGRQELDGELIEEVEGALWTREMVEGCRVSARADPPPLAVGESPLPRGGGEWRRVVVGVDPPASSHGDACGIIVAALRQDGIAVVLADCSVERPTPEGWARAVCAAAAAFGADRVIAEANNGGDMVVSTLRSVEANLPVKKVHAARGKVARAEPVAALYAGGRVRHAGVFARLEDEMCGMVSGGDYQGPGRSADRADALVWALTELMLGPVRMGPRVRVI